MQKKTYLILIGAALGMLFSSISEATLTLPSWRPVLALTAGNAFSSDLGQSTNFPANSTSFSYYNYAANHGTMASYFIGGLAGAEFAPNTTWALQTGIACYIPQAFDAKGSVTQGVDTASANQYSYQYSIQNYQLLLENKLLYHFQRYNPYVLIGIGCSWNRSKDFEASINPPFTTFSNSFPANTVTSFTYDIGFGMDTTFTEQTRLGIGYRFTDLGSAKTGKATINQIPTNNVLSQSHLYAQEILAQITLLY